MFKDLFNRLTSRTTKNSTRRKQQRSLNSTLAAIEKLEERQLLSATGSDDHAHHGHAHSIYASRAEYNAAVRSVQIDEHNESTIFPKGENFSAGASWTTDGQGSYTFGKAAVVTYSFASPSRTYRGDRGTIIPIEQFMPKGAKDEIRRAFRAWEDVADIRFVEVRDNGLNFADPDARGDIRIGGENLGGVGGVLAHAFFPIPPTVSFHKIGGDLHFDTAEDWRIQPKRNAPKPTTLEPNPDPFFGIFQVALHELGHAIGLGHTAVPNSVMNPVYSRQTATRLRRDDIRGAQFIYGFTKKEPTYFSPDKTTTYISSNGKRLRATQNDIVKLQINRKNQSYRYSLYLDGSDVGLRGSAGAIDALHVLSNGNAIISTRGNITVGGVRATGSDLIQFAPRTTGVRTSGNWSMYLDGSDVHLTTAGENINGITRSKRGRWLITTTGSFRVRGARGKAQDVLEFTPTRVGKNNIGLGDVTRGRFRLHVDGSDVKLTTAGENIDALVFDDVTNDLFLSTKGRSNVSPLISNAGSSDVLALKVGVPGTRTRGTYGPSFKLVAAQFGLDAGNISGLAFQVIKKKPTSNSPQNPWTRRGKSPKIPGRTPFGLSALSSSSSVTGLSSSSSNNLVSQVLNTSALPAGVTLVSSSSQAEASSYQDDVPVTADASQDQIDQLMTDLNLFDAGLLALT